MNIFLLELLRYVFLFLIYFFLYRVIITIMKDISSTTPEGSGILLVKNSSYAEMAIGKKIPLSPPFRIGKGADNDIIIKDGYISNEHVRFFFDKGHIWLEDMGSTNGTLLNGNSVKNAQSLKDGDKIDIAGVIVLEFRKG